MDEKYADKRLVQFNKDCILAGPRTSVIGFLKFLKELGVEDSKSPALISSKSNVVLLLKNEGTNRKFPKVMLLSRSWWDYYYNPKKIGKRKPNLKTYNIARQWNKVCKEVLLVEDIPTLIPE